jgi:transposase-like protein
MNKLTKCTRCGSENCIKAGFKETVNGKVQRYKCKDCKREFTNQEKFHHLDNDKVKLIEKMYEEKGEQRKIARILGVHLRTIQHHLKKTS